MTSYISYLLRAVMIASICTAVVIDCTGCGGASVDPKQRAMIQGQIARDLTFAYNANKFLCIRLPEGGPYVVVVVESSKEAPTASALLRRYRIAGSVEVKTVDEYYSDDLIGLEKQIDSMRPRSMSFSKVNVTHELFYGSLHCPQVDIQLGTEGKVRPEVIAWARSVAAHYDSDLVRYEYDPRGVPLAGRARSVSPKSAPG